jgi:hypothetical protein
MDVMADLADMGTFLGGFSALGAVGLWTRKKVAHRRERRATAQLRDWRGYIDVHGINAWHVRLVEDPESPTARVVLEIISDKGRPDPNGAQNLRQHVTGDGMLARDPSPRERDFLSALYTERRHSNGIPIR